MGERENKNKKREAAKNKQTNNPNTIQTKQTQNKHKTNTKQT